MSIKASQPPEKEATKTPEAFVVMAEARPQRRDGPATLERMLDRLVLDPHERPAPLRFAFAVACVAAFAGLAGLVELRTDAQAAPMTLQVLGVLLAAAYGGMGPGLLSVALTLMTADYLLVDPHFSFGVHASGDWVRLATLALVSGVLVALFESVRVAQRRAQSLADVRKQLLAAVMASEERWHSFAEATPALIGELMPDGRLTYCNPHYLEYTGLSFDELQREPFAAIHPDDRARVGEAWIRSLRTGEPVREEWRLRGADGTYRWHVGFAMQTKTSRNGGAPWIGAALDIEDRKRVEAELAHQRDQLQLITDSVPVLIAYVDTERRYRFVNKAYEDWFGQPVSRIAGRHMAEILGDGPYAKIAQHVDEALAGRRVTFQNCVPRRDGNERWVDAKYVPDLGPDGRARGFFAVVDDVTERKQAHERIAFQATLLGAVDQAAVALDLDANIIYWNRYAEMRFGWSEEEVLGHNIMDIVVPRVTMDEALAILERLRRGESWSGEFRVRRRDGSIMFTEVSAGPVKDEQGNVIATMGVSIDVTERKQAEEALRQSEAHLRRLADANIVGVIAGAGDAIVEANDVFLRTLGYTRDEFARDGLRRTALTPPGGEGLDAEAYAELRERGARQAGEREYLRKDGTRVPVLVGAIMLEPDPFRWVGFVVDLSEQKRSQEAAREWATRYEAVIQASGQVLYDVDRDTGEAVYGGSTERMLGYTAHELNGGFDRWARLIHPDDLPVCTAEYERQASHRERVELEYRVRRADGEYIYIEDRSYVLPSHDGSGKRVVGLIADITARKRAECALQQALAAREESFALLDTLLNTAPVGLAYWDREGRYLRVNRALAEGNGYTPEEHIGRTVQELVPDLWPDIQAALTQVLTTGEPLLNVELSGETRLEPGRKRHWLRSYYPITNSSGEILGVAAVIVEITQRKEAEQRIENMYREATRSWQHLEEINAAKDEFLGAVSHELKTPITTIVGNAEVLEKRGHLLDERQRADALSDIRREGERLHRLIDSLLVLARLERGQQIEQEPVLVQHLLQTLTDQHRRTYPHRDLTMQAADDLPPVNAVHTYVEQVVRNLLTNAEKYSPGRTPIDVEARRDGDQVRITVLDRGVGIPPREIPHIFTPFYRSPRTAHHVEGFGIGLAVCKRLIEAQSGSIWAQRRDGGGMEFGIALPVVAGEAEPT